MADEVKKIEETVVAEAPKVEEPKAEEAKVEEPKAEEAKVEETATVTPEVPKVEEAYAESEREIEEAAKWTTKFINTLPNSSFAVVEPAYKEGKTDNKNARHLPFKDASGKIDLPHYRNALARANQIKAVTDSISDEELRKQAMAELEKHRDVLKAEDAPKVEAQKICPECNQPMMDEECANCKQKKMMAEAPKAEEVKVEAQPMVEAPKVADVVVVTETTQKVTDTMSQNSETIKVETTEVRSVNDQEQQKTVTTQEITYTYAQMEEVKAGYEKQIAELKEQISSKEKEVETLKAAQIKVEEKVEAKEEPVVLATGHKKVEASEETGSPIAKILRSKKAYRK